VINRVSVTIACMLIAACNGDAVVEEPVPIEGERSPIEYPVELWDRGVQGETVLMIHVSALGVVDSALVSVPSGYAEFDSAAVAGARNLKFTPGKRGEKRVAMWTKMPVRFARDSTATLGPSTGAGMNSND
jgi:TonB family protein